MSCAVELLHTAWVCLTDAAVCMKLINESLLNIVILQVIVQTQQHYICLIRKLRKRSLG